MAAINDLISQIQDKELRERIQHEVDKMAKQKKFGLVFEEHLPECTPLYDVPVKVGATVAKRTGKVNDIYKVLSITDGVASCLHREDVEVISVPVDELVCIAEFGEPIYPYLKPLDSVCNAPDSDLWHTLIEADNYHALQLLEYLYAGKVDCIYIDPPYNTGAKDWKYNNDYVDSSDTYRHSKWLSMMQKRLKLAKKLLNPKDSVLIVTIDEKEYLHLGCLLEEMFPEARIQMVSSVINHAGVTIGDSFSRSNEFLFFVKLGSSAPVALSLSPEWRGNTKSVKKEKLVWNQLMRSGTGVKRTDRPNMFYPIFVNENGTKIVSIGEAISIDTPRETVKSSEGIKVIWPIRSNGEEGRWRIGRENLIDIYKKGYVRLGSFTKTGMAITYLASGEQSKVENGIFPIIGHRDDGSIIEGEMTQERKFIPGSQWDLPSHNATYQGSQLLNKIIGENRFSFPKSLYAVHDAIRFFVANKPNALIVDFFAGSGTTLHAVNLLNAEDGGHRRCIMVTNNEVSADEAKALTEQGYHPGDEEWDNLGIARYVTWPRTVCSIEGHDVNGEPLKGNYIGSDIPMSDGFKANAAFFKLGFLDKNAVALGRQFKEMLPTLWMKAGAIGKCPVIESEIPSILFLPDNHFAVLTEESAFGELETMLSEHPEVQTVFIVTDYEAGYCAMAKSLKVERTYQLYRDYLDNFRINTGRDKK
ncbi:site-specific DNA-methyltransferase [uncultured Ruthenibacterium sp.]|uniref:site-specific DNA-methyltransferase n=1 Tax=uncultured Ruthenibacterium sp. TaxID=1905347 RepID=UPI00349E6114